MTLEEAYDPEAFRLAGHRLIDALGDHLASALGRDDAPVLPVRTPDALIAEFDASFPEEPCEDLVDGLMRVARRSNRLHHPRYVGHQVAPPLPLAALAEAVAALLNNGMAIFEMGQPHTIVERHVLRFLASELGLDAEQADGVLTNGGSLGNLTALLAARQAKAANDAWNEGTDGSRLAVLVSDQSHYSVARAVQVMGFGAGGVAPVRTDDALRMDPADLPAALERARSAGRRVIAVVANACSTATGSFDPIGAIADFCAAHDLWLHVDGAHGAPFALSRRHGHLVAGIERADSIVCDLHKLMMLPALNTAVLFREGRRSYEAFAQEASYLFGGDPTEEWFNVGQRTLECTKRGMGVVAYTVLRALGVAPFRDYLDRVADLTQAFADLVEASPDFELAVRPQGNIVCFRHVVAGADPERDSRQRRLRKRIVDGGRFYVVLATVRGAAYLRMTLIHPLTTLDDLAELLDALRAGAEENAR